MALALDLMEIVAVVGSGTMGAGIAQVAAAAGHPVRLFDTRPEAADRAIAEIRKAYGRLVEKGRMSGEAAASAGARITPVSSLDDLAGAGLIVEAISENLDAKRALFASLEPIVGDDCILATNTSSISVTAIGAGLRRPQRVVGMHFFNPVPAMALVEVVSGLATDRAVAERIHATAAAWGKSPVHAACTPGFIVNRVARPYYAEALRVATEQGGTSATLDAVMRESGGFRMGPFELMDLIGHDVNFAVTCSVFNAYFGDRRFAPSLMQQELVNAGFLGRKSGRGFYTYGSDAVAEVPQSEPVCPAPTRVALYGRDSRVDALAARFESAGIAVERQWARDKQDALLECNGATLFLTDGRTATQRACDLGVRDTILLDLALDFGTAARVALARADQCSDVAFDAVVGLFQAAGFAVSRIGDVPGMIVMRTVAMLANEAADAVNQGVCSAQEIDIAMKKGVNYPQGPLAWGDAIGPGYLLKVLRNLGATYGEDRYRVSPLIQRQVASGRKFHE